MPEPPRQYRDSTQERWYYYPVGIAALGMVLPFVCVSEWVSRMKEKFRGLMAAGSQA